MNTRDVLRYGHDTVVKTIDGLPYEKWDEGSVCGVWSVKQIIAHLASYETLLEDVFNSLHQGGPTPHLDRLFELGDGFNDADVASRVGQSAEATWNEYVRNHEQNLARLEKVPVDRLRQAGALAWYGDEYDVEDFIVYTFYGHKREHSAQIAVYRDRVG